MLWRWKGDFSIFWAGGNHCCEPYQLNNSGFQNKVVLGSSTRKVFLFPEKLGTFFSSQCKHCVFTFASSARKLRADLKAELQSHLIPRETELAVIRGPHPLTAIPTPQR